MESNVLEDPSTVLQALPSPYFKQTCECNRQQENILLKDTFQENDSNSFLHEKHSGVNLPFTDRDHLVTALRHLKKNKPYLNASNMINNTALLPSAFDLFCMCTSVRGMAKLSKGPRFLRLLWLAYVISMGILLLTASVLLVREFLNYDVRLDTRVKLDDKSPFPALTICHHNPFSYDAHKAWENNSIISPSKFNQHIRKLTSDLLSRGSINLIGTVNFMDTLNVYYQNLNLSEVMRLGHKTSIFWNCVRSINQTYIFEEDCNALRGYKVKVYSNPQYLTCHTFEPLDMDEANGTTFLSLIVNMGPNTSNVHEQAFLPDIFEQARGLRVVVHEVGTLPNLAKSGLHVEPGKLNEINYEPIRWRKLDTPKKHCHEPNPSYQFYDLEAKFNYTHEQCIELRKQHHIMQKCGCIYFTMPRPVIPNLSLPYCANIMQNFSESEFLRRILCLHEFFTDKELLNGIRHSCSPLCNFYDYSSTISITKWRADTWKLYWLRLQNAALADLESHLMDCPNCSVSNASFMPMFDYYLTKKDLTKLPNSMDLKDWNKEHPNNVDPLPKITRTGELGHMDLQNDQFAYVVLKRKSENTIEKTEKLVLSMYVLVSRIGGLCSLTIGLTAAFAVEIMEFSYLLVVRWMKQNAHTRRSPATHNTKMILKDNGNEITSEKLNDTPNISCEMLSQEFDKRVRKIVSEELNSFIMINDAINFKSTDNASLEYAESRLYAALTLGTYAKTRQIDDNNVSKLSMSKDTNMFDTEKVIEKNSDELLEELQPLATSAAYSVELKDNNDDKPWTTSNNIVRRAKFGSSPLIQGIQDNCVLLDKRRGSTTLRNRQWFSSRKKVKCRKVSKSEIDEESKFPISLTEQKTCPTKVKGNCIGGKRELDRFALERF